MTFSLELLDLIQRLYEADESFNILSLMVRTRLFIGLHHFVSSSRDGRPAGILGWVQLRDQSRRHEALLYFISCILTLIGIFAMRWNVVIGGQLFSKSFLGYTTYKLEFATREGLLTSIVLLILPFLILAGLACLLPPWKEEPKTARN